MVGDLVPELRRESSYGTLRVVSNMGYVLGPPLGGVALAGRHWFAFFIGIASIGLISALVAFVRLPIDHSNHTMVLRESRKIRTLLRDVPFVLLLMSTFDGIFLWT